jgi:hypothetical protein
METNNLSNINNGTLTVGTTPQSHDNSQFIDAFINDDCMVDF